MESIRVADIFLAPKAKVSDNPTALRDVDFLILDGAMGTLLWNKGLPKDMELWSLFALIDKEHHSKIISAHKDYLKAGATIITTNTYSCVPLYIEKCKDSDRWTSDGKPDCAAMIRLAVDLANTARTEFLNETKTGTSSEVLIAGSIPPLMESYNPSTMLSKKESIHHYELIIRTFMASKIDLFLIETMSTFKEAKWVLDAMILNRLSKDSADGRDIFLFFALREDGKLRDGMDFNKMMVKLDEYLEVLPIVMVGANCCKPEAFEMMMEGINKETMTILKEKGVSMGCYPNGMSDIPDHFVLTKNNSASQDEDTPKIQIRKDLTAEAMYDRYYKEWIQRYNNDEYRLRLIGGCCHVLPDVIEYAAKKVKKDFPGLVRETRSMDNGRQWRRFDLMMIVVFLFGFLYINMY